LDYEIAKGFTLSTTEAEYVFTTEAAKEMIWLQRFMEELIKKHENSRLIVKVRLSFILQRTISPSILGLNIYISCTISYV
jgi:hypothetical protein